MMGHQLDDPVKILVVEDDPQVSSVILAMLKSAGYEARSAPGAQGAIAALRSFHADIVLTDMVMPEGEGMELILHLSRSPRRPSIIAMSGNPTGMLFLRASTILGVRATLVKPFDASDLADALAAAMVN